VAQKYFMCIFMVHSVNTGCLSLSKLYQLTCILSFIIHLSGMRFVKDVTKKVHIIKERSFWDKT
jgi:hypothetical protein